MKQLFLIRHAKSSWDDADLTDFERPLNKRGREDAPIIGFELKKKNLYPDMIISSPANRALTTARIIANAIDFPLRNIIVKEQLYESLVEDMIDAMSKSLSDNIQTAFLFGHNPGLQMLADHIAGFPYDNFPTCGVIGLSLDINTWSDIRKGCGIIVEYIKPKQFKQIT